MLQRLPMFVFGTLRYGESNHHFLENRYDKRLPAELVGYVRVESELGYPMIDLSSEESVTGELFFLSEACYDQTMTDIDELELLPPGNTSANGMKGKPSPFQHSKESSPLGSMLNQHTARTKISNSRFIHDMTHF